MSGLPETPELDKLTALKERSQPIGEFLEWLSFEKDINLPGTIERLLAEYFDIDLDEVEWEKRAILAHIQAQQGG